MKENRPLTSPNLPGSVTKIPAASVTTTTTKASAGAPRPRSQSITDETTLPGVAVKGVTPRAPAVSRMDAEPPPDPRAVAVAVAKEIVAPVEVRLAELEWRLVQLETATKRAQSRVEASPQSTTLVMAPAAPAPSVAAPMTLPLPVPAPMALPLPVAPPVPAPMIAVAPAAIAPIAPVATVATVATSAMEPAPVSIPFPVIVNPSPQMRASMASIHIDDRPLSHDEYSMFDGGKRQRRVAWAFVVVLLLLGGGLALGFATCQQ